MIDRIIPRFYASDKDQRFTDEGVMVEALNVTLTESDEKTGNVLKNTKSNVAIPADATAQLQTDSNGAPRDVTIIGSIEDDKNNHVYFFVACPTTANIHGDENHPVYSAIFRYELETLSYTKILDNVHLKFDSNSFIKADIIHGTFGKNIDEQPIIYFTDNINPPRKINVSRALLGEYDLNSSRDFNYAASTMRAAPTKAPSTALESDDTVSVNSIDGNFFQFACQIVYADGEESAVGPYSDLAICRPTFLNALTSTAGQNFGVERLVDNVINVDLNIDLTIPGIDKINVLCRNGNEGTWFIADSFEPYVDVKRNISGVEKLVFEAGGNRYKFYNDSIGQLVPPVTTQKNFDNVPLVARGQSIIKNRLFYSNYEEGFENVDAGLATIQDIYSNSQAGSSEAFPSSVHNDLITQEDCDSATGTSNMDVVLDLTEGVGYTDENTAVGAGTKYSISFQWAPSCTLSNGGDDYLRYTFPLTYRNTYVNAQGGLSFGISRTLGEFSMDFAQAIPLYYVQADSEPGVNIDSIPIKVKDGNVKNKRKRYSFDYTLGTDGNLGDVAIGLSNEMLDSDLTVRYTYCMPLTLTSSNASNQINLNDNIPDTPNFGEFDTQVQGLNSRHKIIVTWDFEVFVEDAKICLRPFISDIELDTPLWFGTSDLVWDGSTDLTTFSRSAGGTSLDVSFVAFDPLAIYNANENPNSQQAPAAGASISLGTPTVTLEENSNDADDLTYTNLGTAHIQGRTASALNVSVVPTFKSGSTHSFGIVYYDEYGRHGFVNPIGSMYSKYPNERVTGTSNGQGMFLADGAVEGVCSARIELSSYSPSGTYGSFSNKITPPPWAKSWQIVYAGSNLTESFIQYEAFSAYPELKVYTANNTLKKELDEETMRIYVRLENLNEYQTQRGVSKSYSFTKGDKLRVIKYKEQENSDGTSPFKFPTASDAEDLTNSIIEFDVVGNVVLTRSLDNPIDPATTDANLADGGKYSGEFIILEAPRINTGVLGYNSEPLRYPGFDWQHVAKFRYGSNSNALLNKTIRYQDGTEQTNGDLYRWGKRTIVEILTPQRSTAEKVYYEIGVGGDVTGYAEAGITLPATGIRGGIQQNNHGLSAENGYVTTSNGDAWYRPVAMRGPKWFNPTPGADPNNLGSGAGNGYSYTTRQNEPLASSVYSTQIVEDSALTDKISSKSWSKGRPHVAYEKAKRIRRYNSITFSEPFNSDVQELTLSSFNAALINYSDLSNKYGAINYIGNYEDMLFAAQENKVSITPVERATLNQAAGGDGVVSLSSAVLNDANTNYMAGDWGVGDNPESVLIYDTQIFFADPSRARVVRLTREGLSPISDKGLSEVFNKEFKTWLNYTTPFKRVVSGYDPSDNVYYISLVKDENNTGKTYGYDVQRGVWQSEYSFVPNLYSRQNDDMFSFKQAGNDVMWVHNNNAVRNTFYGTPNFSRLKVISKFNPSMSKIYKAIGINGGTAMDTRITSSVGHDTGEATSVMPASSYALREGQHYREIPGDISLVDAQHYKGIGKCSTVSSNVLNMEDLSGVNVPIGALAHYINDDGDVVFISTGIVTGVDYETNQITLAAGANAAAGRDIVLSFRIQSDGNPEGARIRGHYAEVFLQSAITSMTTPFEIYSIDLNYENSKPNYALGQ